MTERERIQALLDEGRITQEEASLLLEALAEAEAAEAEAEAQAGPTRWLRARVSARTLEVRVDPSLSEPRVEGEAEFRAKGTDYHLDARPKGPKGWHGGEWHAHERPVTVSLPGGVGLDVDLSAGTVIADDLPYLRASVGAGNLIARNLGGIDANVKAGTLNAELYLDQGQHRVQVKAGSAVLKLLPGSDYEAQGEVIMGNFTSTGKHRLDNERGFPGMRQSFNILEGQGRAKLEIQVKMGSLNLLT
ncbi:hypothetical protein [Calidithermus terrae]|nr:hypothetical protein [Calidithermus terrae]